MTEKEKIYYQTHKDEYRERAKKWQAKNRGTHISTSKGITTIKYKATIEDDVKMRKDILRKIHHHFGSKEPIVIVDSKCIEVMFVEGWVDANTIFQDIEEIVKSSKTV